MNIFKKIIEVIKNIFSKKEEIAMLQEGKEYIDNQRDKFMENLRVKVLNKKKKVESHVCYGDGLGIKKKLEY